MTKTGWAATMDYVQAEVLSGYVDAKRETEQVHRSRCTAASLQRAEKL